ncbi:MAG TPA: cytochrome c peroxidase [Blastocatellia bacterium]
MVKRALKKSCFFAAFAVFAIFSATSVYRGSSADDQKPSKAHAQAQAVDKAKELRRTLIARVGSTDKLTVPAQNSALPQPNLADGVTPDPLYITTEPKRYLGKLLFFDPVRTNRINPAFGGVPSTLQTGSCGSCHLGEAASRAGQVINFNLAGEGRGYFDAQGVYHIRRRLMPDFADVIPTGDMDTVNGVVVKDGRFDAVDSVPRLSPSVIGFAFNNRIFLGGKAGQPAGDPNNPNDLPAGENACQIAFDNHRMLDTQSSAVQQIPSYVELFKEAFPTEAATYAQSGNLNDLISDDTIERAVATYLRTVVTRNTPWDKFLAGDDTALTESQIEGGLLFAKDIDKGGFNCISCHSGPMLNKQLGDEAGVLVEENFYNLGVGDHPLQELAMQAENNPNLYDIGRGQITLQSADNFKFRALTLRQLKDSGGQLMHSALFSSVTQVIQYFNAGTPEDPVATAAGNVTTRFTQPRGPGQPPGLGATDKQIAQLDDFIENGLYDPAFAQYDPNSTTTLFELSPVEITYSVNRPDLAALGAIDGLVPSGLCPDDNDALSRRDHGLEFLDVTSSISIGDNGTTVDRKTGIQTQSLTLTNITGNIIDTNLILCFGSLPNGVKIVNASGNTTAQPTPGLPYIRLYLPDGEIPPDGSLNMEIQFTAPAGVSLSYNMDMLSGQGMP